MSYKLRDVIALVESKINILQYQESQEFIRGYIGCLSFIKTWFKDTPDDKYVWRNIEENPPPSGLVVLIKIGSNNYVGGRVATQEGNQWFINNLEGITCIKQIPQYWSDIPPSVCQAPKEDL